MIAMALVMMSMILMMMMMVTMMLSMIAMVTMMVMKSMMMSMMLRCCGHVHRGNLAWDSLFDGKSAAARYYKKRLAFEVDSQVS